MVIRKHNSTCILACHEHIEEVTPPELAEALVLRLVVALTRQEVFQKAIFASDCLPIIERIHSRKADRSRIGTVVFDIKVLGG